MFILLFYITISFAYWIFIRPKNNNWGASLAEKNMLFPVKEPISDNRIVSTRSINIKATKENVWTFVAQTGQNRGGFNSYYWLENLFGAKMLNNGIPNSKWQNPKVGDTVYYGYNQPFSKITFVKKNEYYSLGGWFFYLKSIGDANTRLIVRYPSMEIKQSNFATIYYYGLFEPLHFIMESGMMMGIKQRAERQYNILNYEK